MPSRTRAYSSASEAALQSLNNLQLAIAKLERRVKEIEWQVAVHNATANVPKKELVESKDAIAQMCGSLDKLQFNGVDGIITADLVTGKADIRDQRKLLNKQCESIRTTMLSLHAQLTSHVAATV
ncbi:hypothetical protein SPRG_03754 [Saprolegnia parasitica CBS 223.65]|uniref:BAG domain-containing protein n=1 Tax=Saprolegnia parasitica (strain CBS 223.65) TaxID=695850 RepID=A0A067CMB7_SAPPC|nr:hypothetical protein SPRG_03754 [Saprolegnia parasitica CBS 223.65]KDO31834.1 hypothetical protein SPRG_03754 [Saprolegnia parasitica CBS 223.65]|eukprot:XP_012197713.1 hypothetical protein SPRG_03754 [Saprolegnia parasitica CBS 223.65]